MNFYRSIRILVVPSGLQLSPSALLVYTRGGRILNKPRLPHKFAT